MNQKLAGIMLLCSLVWVGPAWAITGTYVDISPANTVAVNGTAPWCSTAAVAGLWQQRAFCNKGTVYQGQGANGMDLKTTIGGLVPGQVYDIYAIYWTKSIGENWGMLAGVDPNRAYATWYNFENGTKTGPTEVAGAIFEMEGLIGAATADKDGNLVVYTFNHAHVTTSHRAWVDGFSYQQAFFAYNPQPTHRATAVPLDAQLSWSTVLDPANPAQRRSGVTEHWVYFSESPRLADGDLLAKVPGPTERVKPPALRANQRYYWAVDEHLADGSYVLGLTWTFETVKTLASFDPPAGRQPANARAKTGETVVFTVQAAVPGAPGLPVGYRWYRGLPGDTSRPLADEPGHIAGAQTAQLSIIVARTDEDSYFCRATSDAGFTDSSAATLLVKRMLAWYKFDGNLTDAVGTRHGTMTNPTYVAGKDGKALSFDGTNCVDLGRESFPKAGLGNGLGAGAVSFWINTPKTDISFVGTFNDGTTTAFRVEYTAGNSLSFLARDDGGVNLTRAINPAGSILNAWHLVTCTWDAETGDAAIYLDGVSTGLARSGQPSRFAPWQYPMVIGARQNRATVEWFYVGAMDDYRLYNYPLSPYEVAELYTALAGGKICVEYPVGDLNRDGVVDQMDLEMLRSNWLQCGWVPATACEFKLDLAEVKALLSAWLAELDTPVAK
jgi:hypothetical protein